MTIAKWQRRRFTEDFKREAVALKAKEILAELSQRWDDHPNRIAERNKLPLERSAGVFGTVGDRDLSSACYHMVS